MKIKMEMGAFIVTVIVFSFGLVNADTWSRLGYGARNQGLGNATTSVATDAYSQIYNPALMSVQNSALFSLGIVGAIYEFEKINGVVLDKPSLGASQVAVGDINTKPRDAFNFVLAYKTRFSKTTSRALSFGIALSSPVERVLGIETQDAFQPQYVMHLNDTQRLGLGVNFSLPLSESFFIGAGGQFFLSQGSNVRLRLPVGGNSTARFKADVQQGISPLVGVLYKPGEWWNVAFVYRGKQDARSEFEVNNTISTIGPTDFIISSQSSFFFDPDMYVLGLSFQNPTDTVALTVRYERWSGYTGTSMGLAFKTFAYNFSQQLPAVPYKDVVSILMGYEHNWSHTSLRVGYNWLPTPVSEPEGDANNLDASRHGVSLGGGQFFEDSILGCPLHVDLSGFVHYLLPRQVTKAQSDNIGAPGYKVGGMIYGYGFTLTADL